MAHVEHLKSVETRHADVERHDVGVEIGEQLLGFLRIARPADRGIAVLREQRLDRAHGERMVVDQENAGVFRSRLAGRTPQTGVMCLARGRRSHAGSSNGVWTNTCRRLYRRMLNGALI